MNMSVGIRKLCFGYICIRGGPLRPLHRDPQWSIVLCVPFKNHISLVRGL
jgi:hypothetical protein